MFERRESDLHVSCRRCDDADEIDVVVGHEVLPIGQDVFNAKLFRGRLSALSRATGDRDNLRSHAIAKPGDLGGPGKPGPDNSDTNW